MTYNLLNLGAIAFYIITWVIIARSVRAHAMAPTDKSKPNKSYFITWTIALSAHFLSIVTPFASTVGLSSNFVALGSYVMWFISLILFVSTLSRRIQALAVLILPLSVLSIVAIIFTGDSSEHAIQLNSGLGIHVLVSLLAYSTLMLAAVQAALLATQNNYLHQRLKNPKQSKFVRTLPALEDMEYFLFHLIGIGVLLLSISLLSGFYFLDNFFGSSVGHKTILSIISWILFTALLIGRKKYGWRGKTAVRWTISGFAVLALAFFGSKFIQEFVIDKEYSKNTSEQFFIAKHQKIDKKMTPPHLLNDFYTTTPRLKVINMTFSQLPFFSDNPSKSSNS